MTGTGDDEIFGSSTLEFDKTIASGQTIGFENGVDGVGNALDLTDPSGFKGQIADFAAGDEVALSGAWRLIGFSENAGGTLGDLTLSIGATKYSFDFQGDYAKSDFHVATGTTTFITHA